MSRNQKKRCICSLPPVSVFAPDAGGGGESVVLTLDEYECLRLMDHLGLTQADCARRMQVARTTVTRIYATARRKLATALTEGRAIEIRGGDVFVCPQPRPECAGNPACCHFNRENQ